MLRRSIFTISAALVAFSTIALAQGKPPDAKNTKKDGNKEVPKLCAEMKKLVDAKKDDEAIDKPMAELVKNFEEYGPKDQKLVADAVTKNFDVLRIPAEPNGDGGGRSSEKPEGEQCRLFQSSIVALSQFHELGAERLIQIYEKPDFKKAKRFRGRILQMIGKTEDPGSVKFLLDKLKDKDDIIVADSITALGNYTKAKEELRREIIDKLIKDFISSQGQANDTSTPQGKVAKDRYDLIAPSMIDTLQRLSNQSALRDPREWEKWWQKNKKKPLS
ncbi:MAG: hypothetical protein ACKVS6_02570 [Planctomycetota bacterium]